MKTLPFILFLAFNYSIGFAQVFRIDSLSKQGVLLDKGWKWHSGDNPDFAKPDFDDAKWAAIDPTKDIFELPQIDKATGQIGWFRIRLALDSALHQQLAMQLYQSGASVIYLNGQLIHRFGVINLNPAQIEAFTPNGGVLSFPRSASPLQVLAVRYALQPNIRYGQHFGTQNPALSIRLNTAEQSAAVVNQHLVVERNGNLIVGAVGILTILFLAFFLFFPARKESLYFAIYALGQVLSWSIFIRLHVLTPVGELYLRNNVFLIIQTISYLFLLQSVYTTLAHKRGWLFWGLMLLGMVAIWCGICVYAWGWYVFAIGVTTFVNLDATRVALVRGRKNQKGAWIIVAGGCVYLVCWLFFQLIDLGYLPPDLRGNFFLVSYLSIPVSFAIFFGYDTALTNRVLGQKLKENETLSTEKQQILATQNEVLERQVTVRTAELIGKNRELEIEGALERVRAKTMAMHKSDELASVMSVLCKEILNLGINSKDMETCYITTFERDEPIGEIYLTTSNGDFIPDSFRAKYDEDYYFKQIFAAWKNGDSFLVLHAEGEKLMNHFAFLHSSVTPSSSIIEIRAEDHIQFPAEIFNHILYFSQGYLDVVTRIPVPEYHEVFKRFGTTLQQAYTRFLDLQKAEAQAREAEIEVALERVRSRTMAMQKSDELTEVAGILFKQVTDMGIKTWTAGFNVWSEDNNSYVDYITSPLGGFIEPYTVNATEFSVLVEVSDAKKRGEEFLVQYVEGDLLKQTYLELSKFGDEKQFEIMLQDGFQFPSHQYDHFVFGAKVSLMFITYEPVPETHDIFKRFGKVFEQTYSRFLDLQKAEAQAREAQIEAALERVRSASLAIHQSYELEKVVAVLFDKLKELRVPFDSAIIYLFDKPKRSIEAWVASKLLQEPVKVNMPYDEEIVNNPIIKDLWYAIETGEDGLNKSYKDEDKDNYYRYEAKYNKAVIPESISDFLLQAESWTTSFATEKNSIVAFDNWQGHLIGNEDFQLLKRFAKVFEQAYVRFLDLQKSEVQAREAQVEVSFERIRASALAMQTSNEFLGVVQTLYEQINTLGHKDLEATIIQFYYVEQGFMKSWHAQNIEHVSGSNTTLGTTQIPFDACRLTSEWLKAYKSSEENYTIVAKGDILREWLHLLVKMSPEIKDRLGDITMYETSNFHFSKFSEGALSMVSTKPFDEESKYLLKRAASAFDLAYTRFLDLQHKEEQALNLAIEKQRLEQTLTELKVTQNQLIQKEKLASLGELTAGIAHEIQNPLNFVNNFSEVSVELVDELKEEINRGDTEEANAIADDLAQNLQKITQHGQRASSIVRGMLEHSRTTTGERQPTDLNALADEYLRLAYQGWRAKDKKVNATLQTDFAADLPSVSVVPQEIGRVLLNLYNNAFYAVQQKQKTAPADYQPTVTVSTKQTSEGIEIRVRDNGMGIPDAVKAKVFQPFFTTKPTGEGTGLGLSLSYDIITKGHSGTIEVESTEGKGTEFVITLHGQ